MIISILYSIRGCYSDYREIKSGAAPKEIFTESMNKPRSNKERSQNPDEHKGFVSEDMLRTVVESAPIGMLMIDEKGKIIYINQAIEQMLGYDRLELIGQAVEKLVPGRVSDKHEHSRISFTKSPEPRMMGRGRDLSALHKGGTEIPVEIGLNPVRTERGTVIVSTIVDITKRKQAEKLLLDREERLHEIMDNTTDAIVVIDKDGAVETCNREAERLMIGCGNMENIWEMITPENKDGFSKKLKKARDGKKITDYETEIKGEGGSRISASMSLVFTGGEAGRFILTIRDISERLMMRQKIIDLEKAQIIGKMSEGFAHHMGTPLASMLLRVQMLKEDVLETPDFSVVGKKLDSIERQILYGQRVIQRLLKFVGKPGTEKKEENISELLKESVEIIRPILKKNKITVDLNIEDEHFVLADSNLMHLVFSDTLVNAVDAMPEGGVITVSSDRTGGACEVSISDKGVGISEETIPHVFEPFYTTKPAGKGTGLGLSVAKRIVQDHGGEISIASVVDSGTTVLIKLPISSPEVKS